MSVVAKAIVGMCVFLLVNLASAHHAFFGVFDSDNLIEMEGELTDVSWRNPHVRFSMLSTDGVTWEIESNSVSILRRMEISADLFGVGDTIRVAGYPALNGDKEMWVNNVLLADGREVVLRPGVDRIWTGEKLGTEAVWMAGGSAEDDTDMTSMFRVWSTHFTGDDRWLWPETYPLTESAAAVQASYNHLTDNPIANCNSKGVPWIMEQPYPVELVEEGGNILMRIEEYDAVRTFHMNGDVPADVEASSLGYSVARWEDDTLVVETTAIDYTQLNSTGIPQSGDIQLVERFSLTDGGSRLAYEVTVTDPATFTEPVLFDKAWVYRPGEQVRPYECTDG